MLRRRSSIAACVLFAVGCATTATGRKQLILMPDSELNAMGSQAFTNMKKQEPISREPQANQYVSCIARALLDANEAETKKWEVVVFESEQANAFALPGGKIGVFTGMLEVAKTQDQLAAVIGHEIAHVTQRHSNERVSQAFVAEGGLAAASAALGGQGQTHDIAMAALGVGAQYGALMPFSRTQESEADAVGLQYMAQAGFDPRGAVELWKNMEAAGGDSPPEFLSTHPSHDTRIADLEKRLPAAWDKYLAAKSRGDAPRCSIEAVTIR